MRTLLVRIAAVILIPLATGCVRRVVLPPTDAAGEDPPPGMVDVNVVAEYESDRWDVFSGGEIVCSTPCTQRLRLGEGLFLRARGGDELEVPPIGLDAPDAKRAVVVAEGTHNGKRVNGIVFTTFGGMGVVTAITLTAVGCSDLDRRAGMCTAGLITGGISAPVTAFAIWLMIDALPKAHVLPVAQAKIADGHPPVTVGMAPNGIVGTF